MLVCAHYWKFIFTSKQIGMILNTTAITEGVLWVRWHAEMISSFPIMVVLTPSNSSIVHHASAWNTRAGALPPPGINHTPTSRSRGSCWTTGTSDSSLSLNSRWLLAPPQLAPEVLVVQVVHPSHPYQVTLGDHLVHQCL